MEYTIVPKPYKMLSGEGCFTLRYDTEIVLSRGCAEQEYGYARLLRDAVEEHTGLLLKIRKGEPSGVNEIYVDYVRAVTPMPETIRELLFQEQTMPDWQCPDAETEKEWRIRTERYRLNITGEQIRITAGYTRGILYGIQTLRQMIAQLCMVLPCVEIEDRPALANRGFYHDAARGRVRKLDAYKRLADKASYYKLNQLQLYVEHSYLFRGLSELWRDDTPLTAEDILELDRYCRTRGIELVPSIASFGHLDKLLKTKQFAPLCVLEGSEKEPFTFVGRMAHHTINPAEDGSWELIRRLLSEFLPLFSSRQFNLCGDETFDLGLGRSKELAEQVGKQRMYVDFIKKICGFLVDNGRRPMFWGDVIVESPELLKELPKSVVCLTWGYDEEEKEDSAARMDQVGAVQYLCPGVQGWRHLMNRLPAAYANISKMCSYAVKYNALGLLNTDWGDYGHLCHPEFSLPGLIYGAEGSWCGALPSEEEMNRKISLLEFGDKTGQVVSLLSELSLQEAGGWGYLVDHMERLVGEDEYSLEDQKGLLQYYVSTKQLPSMNRRIEDLVLELSVHAGNLNAKGRKRLNAYFIHAEGQKIFNRIVELLAESFGLSEKSSADAKKLADELETWFYAYKELWREDSRESELYHISDTILWYADFLRDY